MSDPKPETFRERLERFYADNWPATGHPGMFRPPNGHEILQEAVRLHEAEMQAKEEALRESERISNMRADALGTAIKGNARVLKACQEYGKADEETVMDAVERMVSELEQARKRIENLQEVLATAVKQTSDANLRSVEAEREAADLRAEVERLKGELGEHNDQDLANCQCMGCRFGAAILDRVSLREKLKALEEENKKKANELSWVNHWRMEHKARAEKAEKALRDLLAYFERMVAATCPGEHDIEPDCKHGLDGLPEVVAARSLLSDSSQPSTEQEEQ